MKSGINFFPKILIFSFTSLFLVLSGCQKDWVKNQMDSVIQQDQKHEQGFLLGADDVYAGFDEKTGQLNLSKRGLVAIPDICKLLRAEDHSKVHFLSLMNNKIRIVNQDLSCLVNLEEINLAYNNIQIIENIGKLPSLKKLSLHKNELKTVNLPQLPGLEELNLGYNNLKSVVGLEKYTQLNRLELQHNIIESLVGIEHLKKLKELKLEFNKLADISFIEKLDNLILITAKGNKLKDEVIKKLDLLNENYVVKFLSGTGEKNKDIE